MIEKIGELVRNLVVVVFVAALLEMLIPRGGFNRYLRLVTGLLAILMVVTFTGNLINRRLPEPSLAGFSTPAGEQEGFLERGRQLWQENQKSALDAYRFALTGMIEQEILGWNNRFPLRINLEIEEDQSSPHFGSIKWALVEIGPAAETALPAGSPIRIEPVKIGPAPTAGPGGGGGKRVPELELVLSRRLQISPESIEVWDVGI